jgi:hypothetical protein
MQRMNWSCQCLSLQRLLLRRVSVDVSMCLCDETAAAALSRPSGSVYVHCQAGIHTRRLVKRPHLLPAGISRSPALIIYYLMTRVRMSLAEVPRTDHFANICTNCYHFVQALQCVKNVRKCVSPNLAFMQQLCDVSEMCECAVRESHTWFGALLCVV